LVDRVPDGGPCCPRRRSARAWLPREDDQGDRRGTRSSPRGGGRVARGWSDAEFVKLAQGVSGGRQRAAGGFRQRTGHRRRESRASAVTLLRRPGQEVPAGPARTSGRRSHGDGADERISLYSAIASTPTRASSPGAQHSPAARCNQASLARRARDAVRRRRGEWRNLTIVPV